MREPHQHGTLKRPDWLCVWVTLVGNVEPTQAVHQLTNKTAIVHEQDCPRTVCHNLHTSYSR